MDTHTYLKTKKIVLSAIAVVASILLILLGRAYNHPRAMADRLIGRSLTEVLLESPELLRLCKDCDIHIPTGTVYWIRPTSWLGPYPDELPRFVVVRDGLIVDTGMDKP